MTRRAIMISVALATAAGACQRPPDARADAAPVADSPGSPTVAPTPEAEPPQTPQPPEAPGGYTLKADAVECGRLDMLGAARAAWAHSPASEETTHILENGQCMPPGLVTKGPPTRYRLDHFETVPWRVSLTGAGWLSGSLRVAQIRQTIQGQTVVTYVGADDLVAPAAKTDSPVG